MHFCEVHFIRDHEASEQGYCLAAAAAIARAHMVGVVIVAAWNLSDAQITGLMHPERWRDYVAELWHDRAVKFKACHKIVKYIGGPHGGCETILNESWIAAQTREANV